MTESLRASGRERRLPGDGAMWLFVVGDLWIFGCYFAAYAFDRARDPAAYLRSQQHLSQGIGVAGTVLLLTSSLFVALAVQAARRGNGGAAARLVAAGGACGVLFLGLKVAEWGRGLAAGHTIGSDPFFTYAYMLTGLHALHVLLGLGILTWLHRTTGARRPDVPRLETGATYWHMVDVLWIVIYALLYLMR